ncbi:hypothetical protein [Lactovum miscens]|uniref:Lipoprotein n=1 Tax=Lactovum miscens TaxID=190387 RepID=A0A841C2B6_9LACT|nr:hypothetical protein [Lactovum miscens]MBB5888086.1 hypothetical protein [Lactovum miscens]
MRKTFQNIALVFTILISAGILVACTPEKKSNSSSSSTSSIISSSQVKSNSSSSNSTSTESSSSVAAASISQTDLIYLLASRVENSEGLYEVQYFNNNDGTTVYVFVNGGINGTGKDYYGNSPSGISLKNEQNSAQFLVKGDQVTFQIPSFPNGVSGNWSEIVWKTQASLTISELQSQFSGKVANATKQVVSITNSSPY